MKIDILTLFPEMFYGFLSESIMKRAIDKGLVTINVHNIRDYSPFKNKQVDDYSYGGGAGMVLMCEPIFLAIEDLRKEDTEVIMLTPSGEEFSQKLAYDFSKSKHIILLCGHYEGFDERIKTIVDRTLSIGDYVLTGGEVPAMVVVDAVTRLIPGVINQESLESETFTDDMVDYPVYTKPAEFRGLRVPEVLLSGHHANIEKWREEKRKQLTELRKGEQKWKERTIIYGDTYLDITEVINGEKSEERIDVGSVPKEYIGEKYTEKGLIIGFTAESMDITALNILPQAWYQTCTITKSIYIALGDLVTGKSGLENMAGPVGVGQVVGAAVSSGPAATMNILLIIAMLTVNLGIFNLLPLPALDGGRLFFMLIELVRGKPVPPEKEGIVHTIGLLLLLALAVVVFFNDIFRILG